MFDFLIDLGTKSYSSVMLNYFKRLAFTQAYWNMFKLTRLVIAIFKLTSQNHL